MEFYVEQAKQINRWQNLINGKTDPENVDLLALVRDLDNAANQQVSLSDLLKSFRRRCPLNDLSSSSTATKVGH